MSNGPRLGKIWMNRSAGGNVTLAGSGATSAVAGFTVLSVNLSGTTLNMPAANAGDVIGAVTVTTSPPGGPPNTPVTLGGADAAKFSLTNGGVIPCNLIVGASNLPSGSYSITLTAT